MTSLVTRLKSSTVCQIIQDHIGTFSGAIRTEKWKKEIRKTSAIQYGLPAITAGPFLWPVHLQLGGITPLLSIATVLTGLLFALLVLLFNTTIAIKKDGYLFESAHDVFRVIDDLRINVTYAIVTSLLLCGALAAAAAVGMPAAHQPQTLPWVWTPLLVFLIVHIGLTSVMILSRFRKAFNYIAR